MNRLLLSLLLFVLPLFANAQRYANKETEKLDYLLYFLNNNYVDTLKTDEIVEEGIRAMLKSQFRPQKEITETANYRIERIGNLTRRIKKH
jgi:hypothetical protein